MKITGQARSGPEARRPDKCSQSTSAGNMVWTYRTDFIFSVPMKQAAP
jgi:hypothetical protein